VSAELLAGVVEFVRRYVVMSQAQADAVALWTAHTHAADAAEASPYLAVTSAEKRSGKTRLLDVLELLAAKPWRVITPSEAVVFRKLDADQPTLLLDEVDAIFNPKANGNHEGLRAILNAGNRRGTSVPRCVGPNQSLRSFSVFSPKALAGIGELPETVADRSVPIRLKRRAPGEQVERFRRRDVESQAQPLRDRAQEWAESHLDTLREARPEIPDELHDRAQDAWEPLLAIADAAGRPWPERARVAATELSNGHEREERSLGVQLLADVRRVFNEQGAEAIATAELLRALTADEEAPWAHYHHDGSPLSARSLAGRLRRYEVSSRTVWLAGGDTAKGYKREWFEDAWERYLTPETDSQASGPSGPAIHAGFSPFSIRQDDPGPDVFGEAANPHEQRDLTDLTDRSAEVGTEGPLEPLADEAAVLAEVDALVAEGHLRRIA
jgi:predicted pyridoxine 5'-phosphate oxidase superfamily flavin-nucleotide-binding protein